METKNIYNLIILDESGSMTSIQKQAVSAVNETIQGIRKASRNADGQNFFVSLVVFEGDGVKGVRTVRERVPIENIENIRGEEYQPGGCTPLYDAMGLSISALSKVTKKEDCVLVTIITDGMENSSKEYSGRVIKDIVAEKRKSGWTFAYIGANQDAVEVARELHIRNALNFEATPTGAGRMGHKLSRSTENYCCCMCEPDIIARGDMDNFFEEDSKKKDK